MAPSTTTDDLTLSVNCMLLTRDDNGRVRAALCACGWTAHGSGAYAQARGHNRLRGPCPLNVPGPGAEDRFPNYREAEEHDAG